MLKTVLQVVGKLFIMHLMTCSNMDNVGIRQIVCVCLVASYARYAIVWKTVQ
jgi:hypothetical protein